MDILRDVITADELRQEQDAVLEDVIISSNPKVVIFDGKPSVILVSTVAYQAQIERLAILEKMETGRRNIAAGRTISNEQVLAELNRLIADTEKVIANAKG